MPAESVFMSLEKVPGQLRAKRFLKQLVRTGHVPHALLFSGMAGVGKMAMALEFAKLLNCLDPHDTDCCDVCSSCRKFDGGHHPDWVWVKKDGASIKLDQIRELKDRLRYRPFEGLWRVVVIQGAQDMREEAGNALLKLLEEPPKHNIFLLTVIESQKLLPTIVSRCCHLRFQPLEDEWIEQYLEDTYDMDADRAHEVARLAEGGLDRARWLAEENRIAHWREVLDNIRKLSEAPMIDFFTLTAQWSQKSEDLEQDLECIKLWVRDLVLSRLMMDYRSALPLDAKTLSAVQGVSVEYLFQLYDLIDRAVQRLRLNPNKQLMLEGLCLAIKDGLYGKGSWNSISQWRENLSF